MMDGADVYTVSCDSILERAATACYRRAEKLNSEIQKAYDYNDMTMASMLKRARDEADRCKTDIRMMKTSSRSVNELDVLRGVIIGLRLLVDRTNRPEYSAGLRIFTDMQLTVTDMVSWPFPSQPATPPYSPPDEGEDPKKVA